MKRRFYPAVLCLLLLRCALPLPLHAQGTAFTYQGRLLSGGQPANGSYDLQFTLTDALSGGSRIGAALTNAPVPVSNGLFVVVLDFGSGAFDGSPRWLEIGVRTQGSPGAYAALSPRQAITAAPYAGFANTAGNVAPGALITANGAGITNLNAANLAGTVIVPVAADLSGSSNYNTAQVGGIATSNLISSFRVNHALRRLAGRVPIMGYTDTSLIDCTEATVVSRAQWLNAKGYVDAGYDKVFVDSGWGTRDAHGALATRTNFPSGIPWLVAALRTNRCSLGLYSYINASFEPTTTPSTAYADGYQLASFGIRHWKIDGVFHLPESSRRYLLEQAAAGLDDGAVAAKLETPVYLTAVFDSGWTSSPWIPGVVNGAYAIEGDGDYVTARGRQNILRQFLAMSSIAGPGCVANPEGLGHSAEDPWWNTNYARADFGVFCMGPFPLWPMKLSDVGWPIYTNREAISINQDPLVVPGLFLGTDSNYGTNYSTQKVLYRPLVNGDIALGCWNWDTNAASLFTVNLARVPGLSTNVARVLDVFGRTNWTATGTLSALVNSGGFNLYRLSR